MRLTKEERPARNKAHMEAARAVQRQSLYRRVLRRIAFFERWQRAIDEGVVIGRHQPDDPLLGEWELDQLASLREWRDELRAEMIAAGQTVD